MGYLQISENMAASPMAESSRDETARKQGDYLLFESSLTYTGQPAIAGKIVDKLIEYFLRK